ncbi:hypothetical protein DITRI_Ditri09bG0148900 [Diplodiscus trichospermus]
MEKYCLKNQWLIQNEFLLCIATIIFLPISFKPALALRLGNETDRLALLALKDQLVGGSPGALNSWNVSNHFCDWEGVRCGRRHQRVSTLNLNGLKLGGIISPFIGNLTFLIDANFSFNKLKGNIPIEFGHLKRIRYLDLGDNNLQGQLPIEITNCSNLQQLILSNNNLTGKIPFDLGGMKNLLELSLANYNLTGSIPSFGNLSSLYFLVLHYNYLEGIISSALGRLSNLDYVDLGTNSLSGTIPPAVYNLSSITTLTLASNQLSGWLPPELGFVYPKLEEFYIGDNQFTGIIPRYLNLAQRLDIAIDVANAIDYLHHDCETMIVHCDLKPTNVLLDDDMVAHVGDFGLAKLMSIETGNIGSDQKSSSMIKGTIGYIAPEIGEFRQRLRSRPQKEGEIWECLVSATKIGIACSIEIPSDRMRIKDDIIQLKATKARLLRTRVYIVDRS